MPRYSNQKSKLLYLIKILYEYTDESHQMSMSEIIDKLASYDISAERKSLYTDMEVIQQFGIDLIRRKHRNFGYYIGKRPFELAELKLLVDSVQSSKFITKTKTRELVKKLESMTSKHNANELERQLYNIDKVKTSNETIYYTVDIIYQAICHSKKIAFKYFEYNAEKEKSLKNNGDYYVVSPYSLIWSNENYYLISHYSKNEELTHFRVDRILDIRLLHESAESIKNVMPKNFNMSKYSKNLFSMFSGEVKNVKLECENSVISAVIDKLGMDICIRKKNCDKVYITAPINVSPPFFAWIFQFENKIRIKSPPDVKNKYIEMAKKIIDKY